LDGCEYLFSETLFSFRRWFLPDWLRVVQILAIGEIVLLSLILELIVIGLLTKFRNKFIFILVITVLTIALSI